MNDSRYKWQNDDYKIIRYKCTSVCNSIALRRPKINEALRQTSHHMTNVPQNHVSCDSCVYHCVTWVCEVWRVDDRSIDTTSSCILGPLNGIVWWIPLILCMLLPTHAYSVDTLNQTRIIIYCESFDDAAVFTFHFVLCSRSGPANDGRCSNNNCQYYSSSV